MKGITHKILNLWRIVHLFVYFLLSAIAQSAGAVENTNWISAEGLGPTPTSVLDKIFNNLMVRFM